MQTLTEPERFNDRLEITGYLTAAAAAAMVILYFGMMFFYPPVRRQPLSLQLGTLLLYGLLCLAGFGIPAGRKGARPALQAYYLGLSAVAAVEVLDQGRWWFALAWFWSVYVLWVLAHPFSIAHVRPLKPGERRLAEAGNGLVLIVAVLGVYAFWQIVQGFRGLWTHSSDQADTLLAALGQVLLGGTLALLLAGVRRLLPLARWLGALLLAGLGLAALPAVVGAEQYPGYWLALAKMAGLIGAGVVLAFSPRLKRAAASPAVT